MGKPETVKELKDLLAQIQKNGEEVEAAALAALKSLKCLKGKKRNGSLEKKLRASWKATPRRS